MSTLQAALEHGRRYPIFPCDKEKHPLISGGFKSATQSTAQITSWWREFPNALIGVPTGVTSGFLVVDIDKKNGHDGIATIRDKGWTLPLTRIQETQSGGQHVFFQAPPDSKFRCSAGVLGDGIDIRANGGYVILWAAEGLPILCDEPPAPLPDWLRKALTKPVSLPTPPLLVVVENSAKIRSALAALDPDTGYQDWVNVGMALHHGTSGSAAGLALWDTWSAQGSKYIPGETSQKWESFGQPAGTPVTLASVFKMAKAVGWQWIDAPKGNGKDKTPPERELPPVEDYAKDNPPAKENRARAEKVKTTYKFSTIDEILARSMEHDWLLKGYIERKQTCVLYGESQSYKSLLAIEMACAIAKGMEWRGHITKPGGVLYIVGEGGGGGLTRRFRAWEIANHISLTGSPLFFREAPTLLPIDTHDLIEGVKEFLQARGWTLELVILDTLARTMQGNENSQEDFAKYQQALDTIRDTFDCTALFSHHTGHMEKDRPRGSYSIIGNADVLLQMEKLDDKLSKLVARKLKDAESPEDMVFQLAVVELGGLDDDGNPVTSVVLRHLRDFQPAPDPPKGYEAMAYNLLSKEKRMMTGDWRKAFFDAVQSSKPDMGYNTLKSAWKRVKSALIDKRLVFEFELFVSTTEQGAKGECTQSAPDAPGYYKGAKGAAPFRVHPLHLTPAPDPESANNTTYSEFVFHVSPGREVPFKADPPITLAMATVAGRKQHGGSFEFAEVQP